MAPKWKKDKKNKKRNDSESSTPQSSVPSVDDEDQKLLQRGACGSSYSHQSGKAVKSTTGAKSTSKRKNSESSTTQSSVLSVDDDEDKLPQGGACGSSSSHQSRSQEKSTRVATSTVSGEGSPNRSLSSRNAPESSPGKNRLAVPAQGSGTVSPNSSPKKSIFTQLTHRLSPKKRSQSPSTDSKCRCESKTNHKTDCPESKKLEADAKRKSPERPNEPKASSSNLSAVISKEKAEGVQSSSSSDPRVKECSNNFPRSEKLLEKDLLSVPEQAKVAVSPKSPRKKNLLAQIKVKMSPKKRSPNHSPLRCGCANRNDHDLECPDSGKREANSSKSETSSSSASPTSKKKQSDASYTSSENSKPSSSKSSSTSGANVEENTLDKENSGNKTASDESKAKCHPKTSSRYTARHELHGIRIDIEKSLKMWFKSFKRHKLGMDRKKVDRVPGIENLDESSLDEFDQIPESHKSRRRSKSFGSNVRVSRRRLLLKRQSNVQSEDESDDDTQMEAAAALLDSSARGKDTDVLKGDEIDVDAELGAGATLSDSSVRPKDRKDGSNADTELGDGETLSDSSVRPKDRKDGRNADPQRDDVTVWSDPSVRPKDRKIQRKDGDDTNIQRRPGIKRPLKIKIVEKTTAVPSVRRHESLSPYPLEPCLCRNQYMHEIGCSREVKARQRRNRRRCRQSGIDPKSKGQQKKGSKKP